MSFPFVFMIFCVVTIDGVVCEKIIKIGMADNVTIDLQSYVADMHVAVTSVQYTADLTAKLVNNLMDKLKENSVDCQCDVGSKQIWRNDYQRTTVAKAHKLHIEPLKWNDARKFCKQEGAELACIDSTDEYQILARILNEAQLRNDIINDTKTAFMGIHSQFEPNDWITIRGNSISVKSSESTLENKCAVLTVRGDLEARDCNKALPYFCQLRAN